MTPKSNALNLAQSAFEAVCKERDEMREELQQWKMLCAWGGTPEHIDQFIKGQQSRIHEAQKVELVCEQLERELENLKACAIHTCHADCQRPSCKSRRENIAMREAIKEAHALMKAMEAVVDAAKCIRHWHDAGTDGMIVSRWHVWKLWEALAALRENDQAQAALAKLQPFIL